MNHREQIETFLKSIDRAGIEDLLAWMDKNGFYDAPCSSKYHLAKPGGLAEHSLNVLHHAIAWTNCLHMKNEITVSFDFIDSIVLCSLLHDLGKAGQFGKQNYIKNSGEDAGSAPFKTNNDLLYVPHEIRSVVIASKFIDLTEEEQFAILYHNGMYGELKGFKGKEMTLLLILHHSDMWAARVTEKEEEK